MTDPTGSKGQGKGKGKEPSKGKGKGKARDSDSSSGKSSGRSSNATPAKGTSGNSQNPSTDLPPQAAPPTSSSSSLTPAARSLHQPGPEHETGAEPEHEPEPDPDPHPHSASQLQHPSSAAPPSARKRPRGSTTGQVTSDPDPVALATSASRRKWSRRPAAAAAAAGAAGAAGAGASGISGAPSVPARVGLRSRVRSDTRGGAGLTSAAEAAVVAGEQRQEGAGPQAEPEHETGHELERTGAATQAGNENPSASSSTRTARGRGGARATRPTATTTRSTRATRTIAATSSAQTTGTAADTANTTQAAQNEASVTTTGRRSRAAGTTTTSTRGARSGTASTRGNTASRRGRTAAATTAAPATAAGARPRRTRQGNVTRAERLQNQRLEVRELGAGLEQLRLDFAALGVELQALNRGQNDQATGVGGEEDGGEAGPDPGTAEEDEANNADQSDDAGDGRLSEPQVTATNERDRPSREPSSSSSSSSSSARNPEFEALQRTVREWRSRILVALRLLGQALEPPPTPLSSHSSSARGSQGNGSAGGDGGAAGADARGHAPDPMTDSPAHDPEQRGFDSDTSMQDVRSRSDSETRTREAEAQGNDYANIMALISPTSPPVASSPAFSSDHRDSSMGSRSSSGIPSDYDPGSPPPAVPYWSSPPGVASDSGDSRDSRGSGGPGGSGEEGVPGEPEDLGEPEREDETTLLLDVENRLFGIAEEMNLFCGL